MGLSLLFDADDTLWENNVLFERVIDDYFAWLAHPTLDRDELQRMFNDIERANAVTHGYGSRVFLRSLAEMLERLRARPATAAETAEIRRLAAAVLEHRIELMPQVARVLDELAGRHRLHLVTKGDRAEQQAKIDASGLADRFGSVHIVPEKDEAVYRGLIGELGLDPQHSWMIGNSPKSDIRPARAAGLRAVFIPHPHTWALEHDELDPTDDGVLTVKALPDLLQHF